MFSRINPRSGLQLLLGLAVFLGFWQLGELFIRWLHMPIPGSIMGMVFIWAALGAGLLPLKWVEPAANLLTKHMSLFFIPPGVGLLKDWGLVSENMAAILLAAFGGTLFVFAATGWAFGKHSSDAEAEKNNTATP